MVLQSRRGRILPYVRPPSMIFIDAAGGYLQHPIRLHLLLHLHLLMVYRWIDLCLTSMFIRHHRGLPVLVGRAPQGNKGPKGPSPLPGEGAGGRDTGGKQDCC